MIQNVLRIIFGLIFILSGIIKLYPIEPFENLLVQYNISNFLVAPFIARAIISLEILIGMYFIFSHKINATIAKAVLLFISLLTVVLIIQLINEGNDINCGCFGELIPLSPIESIAKNVGLVIMLLFVRKSDYNYQLKYSKWIFPPVILLLSAFTPYIINPVGLANIQSTQLNEKIDFSEMPPLYLTENKVDFSQGKKLVVFLSTSCEHCKVTAGRLSMLKKKEGLDNIYYVIGGKDQQLYNDFITSTRSENVPIIRFNSNDFFKYSGGEIPALVFIEEGILKKKWTGDLFDIEEVENALKN